MDFSNPPIQYWHCLVKLADREETAIVNDLRYEDLERTIVRPWLLARIYLLIRAVDRKRNASKGDAVVEAAGGKRGE
jgi:hypothetical protein